MEDYNYAHILFLITGKLIEIGIFHKRILFGHI
jgi:hypothetical protein